MRITVVGAGIMGLSTAWALARKGHKVHVVDQGLIPNPYASSVDQHRLIRHPYGAERGYTRMINRAHEAWDRMWADLGARHYFETGTLVLESGIGSWTADTVKSLEAEKIPFRRLEPRDLAREFPLMRAERMHYALHLETGGVLFAERIVSSLARHLAARGVQFNAGTPVRDIDAERGRVTIDGGKTIDADLVVVAAGAWLPILLPAYAQRITPSRQVVVYLIPPSDMVSAWQRHPLLLDIDPKAGFYLVPPRDGTGLKVGDHGFTLRGDPNRDREAIAAEANATVGLCRDRLARFDEYRIGAAKTCFYDVEPREQFIVEKIGDKGWVMSGFSGHGFKFAAVLGLQFEKTIAGKRTSDSLTKWAAGKI
jgi:glycine/D-amino acid oxidase-like deaminating enzyme